MDTVIIEKNSAGAQKLQEDLHQKLTELLDNPLSDDVLTRYIVVLLASRKPKHKVEEEIRSLLGELADSLLPWLETQLIEHGHEYGEYVAALQDEEMLDRPESPQADLPLDDVPASQHQPREEGQYSDDVAGHQFDHDRSSRRHRAIKFEPRGDPSRESREPSRATRPFGSHARSADEQDRAGGRTDHRDHRDVPRPMHHEERDRRGASSSGGAGGSSRRLEDGHWGRHHGDRHGDGRRGGGGSGGEGHRNGHRDEREHERAALERAGDRLAEARFSRAPPREQDERAGERPSGRPGGDRAFGERDRPAVHGVGAGLFQQAMRHATHGEPSGGRGGGFGGPGGHGREPREPPTAVMHGDRWTAAEEGRGLRNGEAQDAEAPDGRHSEERVSVFDRLQPRKRSIFERLEVPERSRGPFQPFQPFGGPDYRAHGMLPPSKQQRRSEGMHSPRDNRSGIIFGPGAQPRTAAAAPEATPPALLARSAPARSFMQQTPISPGAANGGAAGAAAPAAASTAAADPVAKELADLKAQMARLQQEITTRTAAGGLGPAAAGSADAEADKRSVVVYNVHFSATPEIVAAHFGICGTIQRLTLLTDRATGQPKGIAYIEFVQQAPSVLKALTLTGSHLLGRPIKVVEKQSTAAAQQRPPFQARPPWAGPAAGGGGGGPPGGASAHSRVWKRPSGGAATSGMVVDTYMASLEQALENETPTRADGVPGVREEPMQI